MMPSTRIPRIRWWWTVMSPRKRTGGRMRRRGVEPSRDLTTNLGFLIIHGQFTSHLVPINVLDRINEGGPRTILGLVHKESKTLRLTRSLIKPQRAFLNLPVHREVAQEPLRRDIKGHIPDINLPRRDIAGPGRRAVVPGQPRRGELGHRDSAVDFLAGLFQGEEGAVGVLEGDEAVPFGLAGVLVEDNDGLVEVAVGGEEGAEGLGGGLGAEAADEELPEGGVAVREGAHSVEDVRVANDGVLEDVEELVVGEGVEEPASVFWGEIESGRGGDAVAILFGFALL
ncbi:LOW QUALITY PROTEIN: hypothetical protein TorRG33x02_248680 [Trema orientale]|uniref:Uncharacterized protein n=1 Tax=Trema orientale TaxID=63057 RepID=A0A2P5DKK0_TREOI|nr:LOW QUALITY PROTEIN: hypothetical protein TorRG33x02_248680 [Trema orientale]